MRKLAIISDIHANICALRECLNVINREGADIVVVNGDILTYGCNPNEVFEELDNFKAYYDLIFIRGNHDEMYFRSTNLSSAYLENVKDFVRESYEWTFVKVLGLEKGASYVIRSANDLSFLEIAKSCLEVCGKGSVSTSTNGDIQMESFQNNNDLLSKETRFSPKFSLNEGLRKMLDYESKLGPKKGSFQGL